MNAERSFLTRALPCLLVLGACSLVARSQVPEQPTPQEIATRAIQAHGQKDYEAFLQDTLLLTELQPNESTHAYNAACGYSLTGNKKKALRWLKKSIDLGFSDQNLIGTDPDLESIRSDKQFAELLEYVRTGKEPKASALDLAVIKPNGYDADKAYPLIVALHGYGRNGSKAAENWQEAAEEIGAILIAPNAPMSMSSSAFQWGDLEEAVPYVSEAVESVMQELKIDPDRVAVTGFSQGGSLAYLMCMRRPDLFCGAVPVAGRYQEASIATLEDDEGPGGDRRLKRVFIMVGEDDKERILTSSTQAVKDLEAGQCEVRIEKYAGLGHAYPEDRTKEQVKALKFVLGE